MHPVRLPQRACLLLGGAGLALALACGGGAGNATQSTSLASGWNGPTQLEADLTKISFNPSLAMDGSGNLFAGWTRTAGTVNSLLASPWLVNGGWQAEGLLTPSTLNQAGSLQDVAMTASQGGRFLFAFDLTQSLYVTTSAVYVGQWAANVGLYNPVQVSPTTGFGTAPALAQDPGSGNTCVAWTEVDGAYTTVMASVLNPSTSAFPDGTTLSASPSANASHPLVGSDASGDAFVAWREAANDASGPWTLKAAAYLPSVGWLAPAAIQVGTGPADPRFALAMTAAGAQVAWSESTDNGATYQVYTRRYVPSANTWSAAVRVSPAGVSAFAPALGMDAAGDVVLAWIQGAASSSAAGSSLWTVSASAAGVWGTPAALVASGNVLSPALAMNGSGAALLAWRQSDGTSYRIAASAYTLNVGWSGPALIQVSTGGDAYAPVVTVGPAGHGGAAWHQVSTTGLTTVYASYYQ